MSTTVRHTPLWAKLREWGVEECNFTYDMQGIGQYFKGFFKDAVPFNNQSAPIARNHQEEEGIKYLYKDLKSQCARYSTILCDTWELEHRCCANIQISLGVLLGTVRTAFAWNILMCSAKGG